ncbi:hypothetical protein [Chryseobacterium sp. LAM-KRS1]|uniref:hypothetical protein n=1 Tax=Chryseobacterium sp. LAM-KRS1 TaxID=2715754 RepID=UPI0015583391|nr:hypothetical protein [Chryseobacterium sp. LAM-KRS1]
MVLKQLNKIIILLALVIGMNVFSQMKMIDINDKEFTVNLKTEKRNIIKIFENNKYTIFYVLNRKDFNSIPKMNVSGRANIIFFSKKYNKGILTNHAQGVYNYNVKKSIYNIALRIDENRLIPSMIILGKDFNYEYFMKYYYMPPPPPKKGNYTSWITFQDTKNYCNTIDVDLIGNVIYENIDDILSNVSKMNSDKSTTNTNCNTIIPAIDLRDFFPEKIIK